MSEFRVEEIGGQTLVCADCLEYLPRMAAGSVDCCFTDPPYGHNNQEGDLQAARVRDNVKGARVAECQPIDNDSPDEMRRVVDAALELLVPVLKHDCCCCCCCCGGGPKPTFAWTAERMDAKGLDFFHAVVWDKSQRGNGMGWRYRRNYEFVMVAHRTGGKLAWADPDVAVPNIVRIMPAIVRDHPNEKPMALPLHFLRPHALPGATVLDPFMGGGSTLEAAERLGMKGIGIERDEHWFEIACRRVEAAAAQPRLDFAAAPKPANVALELEMV